VTSSKLKKNTEDRNVMKCRVEHEIENFREGKLTFNQK